MVRDGVGGITLEAIADEAGMHRSLLRHNIGNREQLLDAFYDRFFAESDRSLHQLLDHLPTRNRAESLVEQLFDQRYTDSQLTLITMALITASTNDQRLRQRLRQWNQQFVDVIARELETSSSMANTDTCNVVATGITAIYFNCESLTPLGDMHELRQASKLAAHRLISNLG